jgi:hypothetical protein
MGIPAQLVLKLVAVQQTPNFVETGTFMGGTIFWAAKHFKHATTIELNPEFSRRASEQPNCPPNIRFLVGNSADVLPMVVAEMEGPGVFWLDGHYSGPGTAGEAEECPVMTELKSLTKAKDPIILIDDARCFLGPPPPPHKADHWPAIDEIFRYIAEAFPGHTTTIAADVIISVPSRLKPVLDADWLEQYDERFPPFVEPKRSLLSRLAGRVARQFSAK